MLLVTGGAGFIGTHFVLDWLDNGTEPVVNLDSLDYASYPQALVPAAATGRHVFVQGDIRTGALLADLFARHRPRAVVHLAAQTHVDRSIDHAAPFVETNVAGTLQLLDAALAYWRTLDAGAQAAFRFLHVSTDEVYGSLAPDAPPFTEDSPYAPNNPYAASKAGADHFVRAYHVTHGLPTLVTHSANNYGPHQFPEKLIPLMIARALSSQTLPVYGDGGQVRDWLYVKDHCRALRTVLAHGAPGRRYNIGGGTEITNLELVQALCRLLDAERPLPGGRYADQVRHVQDRPGHDRRYALDTRRIREELGWTPRERFAEGLRHTVRWYLESGAHKP